MFTDFKDQKFSDLMEKLSEAVEVKKENLFQAFIGFSKRGSWLNPESSIKYIVEKHRDVQYKPKLFLFETTQEEKKSLNNHKELIFTYGLSINPQKESRGWSYRESGDKHPTFVKAIPAYRSNTVQWLFKKIFEKIIHFTDIIRKSKEEEEEISTT